MERVGFFKKKERRWCHKGLSHDSGRQWRHYESRRWVLSQVDDEIVWRENRRCKGEAG